LPNSLDAIHRELALANRILGNEGVIDAFGHASIRNPNNPDRYFLSCSRSPLFVSPDDIMEFDLDSQLARPSKKHPYGERVIHGEIYKARPDVNAVCHHHAPPILPFCISGMELKPVYHLGATMGAVVPFWDSRDDFGDTTLIVAKPEEGASLAKALGPNWTVLMRRHGATVAGTSLEELTFRTIYTARNAAMQIQAHGLGHVSPLTAKEAELAGEYNLRPGPVARAWEYWSVRLDKAEGIWKAAKPKATKKPAKRMAKKNKPTSRR
jgi:ribulose-5-phosphate 4-epimerase/fuculose-1-phosphate aldolase